MQNHAFFNLGPPENRVFAVLAQRSEPTPFFHRFWSLLASVLLAFWLRLVPFGPQVPPAASKGTSRAPPGAPLGSQKSTQTLPRSPQRAKRCLQRASGTPLGSIFKPPALRLGCTVYVRPSVQMLQCTEPTRSSAFEAPCFNPGPAECAERLNPPPPRRGAGRAEPKL